MSVQRRIDQLSAAIARFLDPADDLRRRLLDRTAVMNADTMAHGLDVSLRPWDRDGLAALWSDEAARMEGALPPELAVVVLGGVLPPSHVQAIAYPYLLGAEVIVKYPSRDPLFPALLVEALGDGVTLVKGLGLGGLLRRADAVITVGDDDSVRAIGNDVSVSTPFLGFGHRTGLGLALSGEAARAPQTADQFARDVVTFDQLGCLSPREIFVVGDVDDAWVLARNLAERFERLPFRASLGVAVEGAIRERYEASRLADSGIVSPDLQWGVYVEDGGVWEGTPGGRHVIVRALPDNFSVVEALAPIAGTLSTVGIAGGEVDPGTCHALVRLGASRIVPAGALQSPPPSWPHDGFRPLASLCRYWSEV